MRNNLGNRFTNRIRCTKKIKKAAHGTAFSVVRRGLGYISANDIQGATGFEPFDLLIVVAMIYGDAVRTSIGMV